MAGVANSREKVSRLGILSTCSCLRVGIFALSVAVSFAVSGNGFWDC
jgi:hypothetical protein